MSKRHGCEALVIGASMGGLLAARVLSAHFDKVTVFERDEVADRPESRKGQPQTRHLHTLLAQGLTVFERFFPTLRDDLVAGGAVLGDMGADIRWHAFGGYRQQFESGMIGIMMSRPFLEHCVRRCVTALPNVTIRGGCEVEELVTTPDRQRVTGVHVKHGARSGASGSSGADAVSEVIEADLVVDTSGRGSATPRWLEALGYQRPAESAVTVNMGYSTRTFRRKPGDLEGAKLILIAPDFPALKRAGNIMPVEGDRWMVTLTGWGKDYPPADANGFTEFTRSLPAPDLYNLLQRVEPLTDVIQHRLPSNLRRHYERLPRFPARHLVLGDAICSFNPVYAQGMTSAAMQAAALEETLEETLEGSADGLDGLSRRYFPKTAKVVDMAWQLAVGEDFRSPDTTGPKPTGLAVLNAYVERVHVATHSDIDVYRAFLDVMNLVQPGTSLLRPGMIWRVLRARPRARQ
jgi:2-polyprenyl-6-methoxyphenol hydroxylase-like FAD-dependent oxidoreductase